MTTEFKLSWKEYIDGMTGRNLVLVSLFGTVLVLAFITLDYYQLTDLFYRFLFLRICSCSIGLFLLYLFYKKKIGVLVFGYTAFCLPCVLLTYLCSLLKGTSLFIYNINFSAAFVLCSFLLTWGWKHTLNITVIFNVFYALFLYLSGISWEELINSGVLILILSSVICTVVCGFRHNQMRREFILRFQLQKLIARQNNANYIIESKNRELILFKDIVESSSDGIIILNVDERNFLINKIIHKNYNFNRLAFFSDSTSLSEYLKLFQFNNLPTGYNGLKYYLEGAPSKFNDTNEITFLNKDGYNIIAETSFLKLNGADNKETIVIVFIRDITIRKSIESKQIKQNLRNYLITINSVNIAQEKERERFAKDLHDGLGQVLTSIKINLVYVHGVIEKQYKQIVNTTIETVSTTINEMRNIAYGIAPPSLIQFGLPSALFEICAKSPLKSGFPVYFNTNFKTKDKLLSKIEEINIYRLIQEAINNILKHSLASKAEICFYKIGKKILLIISDNGIGFDINITSDSIGLKSIKTRCEIMGGSFSIQTTSGTTVLITINKELNYEKRINE